MDPVVSVVQLPGACDPARSGTRVGWYRSRYWELALTGRGVDRLRSANSSGKSCSRLEGERRDYRSEVGNLRSLRAFEKAGFAETETVQLAGENVRRRVVRLDHPQIHYTGNQYTGNKLFMGFVSIPEAIDTVRAGGMVIVVDDEDRENEGDLTSRPNALPRT